MLTYMLIVAPFRIYILFANTGFEVAFLVWIQREIVRVPVSEIPLHRSGLGKALAKLPALLLNQLSQ